jgi:hypothetical protein
MCDYLFFPVAVLFLIVSVPVFTVLIYPILIFGAVVGSIVEGVKFFSVVPLLGVYRIFNSKRIEGIQTRLLLSLVHIVVSPIIPLLYVVLLPFVLIFVSIAKSFSFSASRFHAIFGDSDQENCNEAINNLMEELQDVNACHMEFMSQMYLRAWGVGGNIYSNSSWRLEVGESPLKVSLLSCIANLVFFLLYYAVTTPIMIVTQLLRLPLALYSFVKARGYRNPCQCLALPVAALLAFVAFLLVTLVVNVNAAARAAAVCSAYGVLPFLSFARDLVDIHAVVHAVAFRYFESDEWPVLCCFACRWCCPSYFIHLWMGIQKQWDLSEDFEKPLASPHTEYVAALSRHDARIFTDTVCGPLNVLIKMFDRLNYDYSWRQYPL